MTNRRPLPSWSILAGLILLLSAGPAARGQLYLDTSQPFERRAADLVSRMTLDEKIGQMQNEAHGIPRLGIPYYNWSAEGLHGILNEGGYATVFPQAIGMVATWDVDLIRAEADVISTEARAWYYRCLERGESTTKAPAPAARRKRRGRGGRGPRRREMISPPGGSLGP